MPSFGFETIAYLLLFILPAYVANAAPVLLGGHFQIDGGMRAYDNRPWLGKGKTWLGIAGGFFAGMLASVLEAHFLTGTSYDLFGGQAEYYIFAGLLLSIGALFGDLLGSFIKRRMGISSGKPSFLDQLLFLFGALLFAYPLSLSIAFHPVSILFLVLFTYFIHRGANEFAHTFGLKKVPW
ncbi:MAG: CDP-2,3-bis-(O-geranylgeranyl)-sn-glycerol synthase, partial [Candidatus Micrarchaeota archaeon]